MHIRLKDGSFADGKLVCSDGPQRLGWQTKGFENAFAFDIDAVRAITRIVSPEEEMPLEPEENILLFELAGGCQVTGKLLSMDDEWLTVESKLLGTIKLSRLETESILSAEGQSQLVYPGIAADGRWQAIESPEDWQVEAGAVTTSKQGVTVSGNIGLPAKSQINLTVSWTGAPEFVLSMGCKAAAKDTKAESPTVTTKLEVWDKQLVLVREVDGNADIAMLTDLTEANAKVELLIFFDQDQGTIAVASQHGKPFETLTLPTPQPYVGPAISLTNLGPSVTLERLEVRRWDGVVPNSPAADTPTVLDRQGNRIDGKITGYVSEARELMIKSPTGEESRLPLANLRHGEIESEKPNAASDKPIDRNFLFDIQLMDGTRLSGKWQASNQDQLCFDAVGLSETIRFAPEHVREILGTSQRYRYVTDESTQRVGTLKIGECQLSGYLLANSPDGSDTGLHWQPYGSFEASKVSQHASGLISYAEEKAPVPIKRPTAQNANGGVILPLLQLLGAQPLNPVLANPAQVVPQQKIADKTSDSPNALEIQFRSGDAISGKVVKIEERGMTFSSSQTKTDFANHEQIDHVWLNKLRSTVVVAPEKRERLMTVPRSMKLDPPTHLFVSVTGDYLRGRLVSLDGETLTIEIRSELTELPISQVAQIIWLHDRDWIEAKKNQVADNTNTEPEQIVSDERPFQVHSVTMDGHGLTMRPLQVVDGVLQGQSDLLGETSVAVKELRQLLFGRDIEDQIVAMRTDPWKLSLALYPRVYREDDSEAGAMPTAKSPLVGNAAPDFLLPTIDGEKFRLSKQSDRIVVLDFWASWCGPCIQTMPLVHEVVTDLGTNKIHMAAINIQETESKARIAIERMGISCDTLLDSDGQTAAAYGAVAIPQTVIIDRNGIVTHVFVGGGSKFVNEFRLALQSVMALDTQPQPIKLTVESFDGGKYARDLWQLGPNLDLVRVQVQDDAVLTNVEIGFQGLAKSIDYTESLSGDFEVRCDVEILEVPLFKDGWINLELVAVGQDGNFHSMMGIDGNNTSQTNASRFSSLYMPSESADKTKREYTFVSHDQISSKGTLCLQRKGNELISGMIEDGVLIEIKRHPCDRTPMTLQVRGFFGEETIGAVKYRVDNLQVLPVTAESRPVQ